MFEHVDNGEKDAVGSDSASGSRRWIGRCLLAAILGLVAAGLAFRTLRPAVNHQDAVFVREPVKLSSRIHLLGRLAPSVAYAVETSAGLVLIDTGLQSDASELIDQLRELGLDESQICAILLTHVHGDHVLGARFLQAMTGAKIYAGQGDSQPLRDGGPREAFFSTFRMEGVATHGTPIDVELIGDEVLDFGDVQFRVLATPGHTPGSICYLLEADGERALFGGDTISSLIGDLGTYAAYLAPRYRGNARDYLQSLKKLRALPTPDLVLPGHPNEEGQPHSPRLTEAQWHAVLDRGIADLRRLVARFDADGEDFLDGNAKPLLPGLLYLGDYRGRTVFVLHTDKERVLIDASGDEGLAEFVESGLQAAGVTPSNLTTVLLTSAEPEAVGGLRTLVGKWPCTVVADSSAHQLLAEACPAGVQLRSPSEWGAAAGIPLSVIPLEQCGPGAVVYRVRWQDRDVVISGTLPSTLNELSRAGMHRTLDRHPGARDGLLQALDSLRRVNPHLWLPSQPKNGQNANLYDDEWRRMLRGNWNELQR